MTTAFEYAKNNADRFLEELLHITRIPSVSTQPEHKGDVRKVAEWLRDDLLKIGFETAELIDMPGGRHPLVLGEWMGAGADAPTVLIYTHYDVQPAVVEDGWNTDPFVPTVVDDKIYARGITDSKIHVIGQLKAAESLFATEGKLPVNVKFIFEGEEESGSETISAFAEKHGDRLKADVCVISDGGMITPGQPSIAYGLRGIIGLEIHVTGPVRDLHSGHFGGNVHNPAQAIAEIVAKLHDDNGFITVPGFYDNVLPVEDEERAVLDKISPWIEDEWKKIAAAPLPWGEKEYTLYERSGVRPTLEINGIAGGYYGDGMKTVLPSKALAKITCRLVPNQDPQRIFDLIKAYVAEITPPTVTVEVTQSDVGAPAILLDRSSKAMQATVVAYEAVWGTEALFERVGGSVPITYAMQKVAKEVTNLGFTHRAGGAHGPNEHIFIDLFHKGIETAIRFYKEYAK
jgi:acetylornithine deacetylase/succinyl-diaminopimelate desuccinylase-like protein